jgi:phosphoenolpyruvate carboxylase
MSRNAIRWPTSPPTRTPKHSQPTCRSWSIRYAHHGEALARGRVDALVRAIAVFGFHLASIDMRQVSDVHEAVIAELFATAGIESDYAALPKRASWNCCWPNCASRAC